MYVCLSVTGLRLKFTGLCIVYIPFWHVPLMISMSTERVVELVVSCKKKMGNFNVRLLLAKKTFHVRQVLLLQH